MASLKNYCMELEIPKISELETIWSPEISIHGIQWKIKAAKKGKDADQSLGVYLFCANKNKSLNWSLWGSASFKLLPFGDDANANPIEFHTGPYAFDASGIGYGTPSLIKWNDLFNQDKKYVKDDTINLEIKVKVENPNDPNQSRLDFECLERSCATLTNRKSAALSALCKAIKRIHASIRGSCANSLFATFRLTVTNVLNLVAVTSPEFTLLGLPWEIQVSKRRSSHLGVRLQMKKLPEEELCKTTMTIKLISSNKDVQPIEKLVTKQYQYLRDLSAVEVVPWDEMVKPENGFVNDNSITLEISIDSEKPDADATPIAKRAKLSPANDSEFLKLECPICLKCIANQKLAVTTCGHMFCFECIKKAISSRANCPTCNNAVQLDTLRQIYLPSVN